MNDRENFYQGSGGDEHSQPLPPPPQGERDRGTTGRGPGRGGVYGSYKSPFVASLLSCMPGLGQIYVGYYVRGFIHLMVVASLITALSGGVHGLEPFLGLSLAFFWLYNIVDAGRRAMRYNMLADGGSVEELPEFRDEMGSRAAGILLTGLGLVLLAHTKLGFDFQWLEEWWPLALVAFGMYLIRKNRASRP